MENTEKKRVVEAIAVLGAMLLTWWMPRLDFSPVEIVPNGWNWSLLILSTFLTAYVYEGLVDVQTGYGDLKSVRSHLYLVLRKSVFMCLIIAMVALLVGIEGVDRALVGTFFLWSTLLLSLARFGLVRIALAGQNKHSMKTVLLIGSKIRAKEIINLIRRDRGGYRVLGALEMDSSLVGRVISPGVKVIGTLGEMEGVLRREVVDEIIITIPLRNIPKVEDYMILAEQSGATLRIIPDWQIYNLAYKPKIASLIFEPFKGLPTMTFVTTPRHRAALIAKDGFDLLAAAALLILFWPLMAAIAIAIKSTSKGPVFFSQERLGLHGRRFNILKFRTMFSDAETLRAQLLSQNESDGPVFKIKEDPRIVPGLGRFLRKSGLDELPQLINIIRGEMSLIGPRPPIPDEVGRYQVPELRRLSVKPGITGLWQSSPNRNQLSFDEWVALDLEYIDNWSLWMDLKIIIRTMVVMLRFDGR